MTRPFLHMVTRAPWSWRRPFAARPWRVSFCIVEGGEMAWRHHPYPSRAAAEIAARASIPRFQ